MGTCSSIERSYNISQNFEYNDDNLSYNEIDNSLNII